MIKALKIGGIVILTLIILMVVVSFFSKLFLGTGTNLKSNDAAFGLPGSSIGLANPLAIDSSRSEKKFT